jgi:hypothetical protein
MKIVKQKKNKRLTRLQKNLVAEINGLLSTLGLNSQDVIDSSTGEERTVRLRLIRNHLVRGEVITAYTLIDDCVGAKLRLYYFKTSKGSIKNLRRSKKVGNFNLLLEEMSLMQKLRQLKNIRSIPSAVTRKIERINALRNRLAHIFFFEGRHSSKYQGKDIFSSEGLDLFMQDVQSLYEYFYPTLYDIDENDKSPEDNA